MVARAFGKTASEVANNQVWKDWIAEKAKKTPELATWKAKVWDKFTGLLPKDGPSSLAFCTQINTWGTGVKDFIDGLKAASDNEAVTGLGRVIQNWFSTETVPPKVAEDLFGSVKTY